MYLFVAYREGKLEEHFLCLRRRGYVEVPSRPNDMHASNIAL